MRFRRDFVRTTQMRYVEGLALILLGLSLILTVSPRTVQAHGGGAPQLTNADAGPYLVSAWTQPDPIRVGELHITVAVSEPPQPGDTDRETGDLVLDATVSVGVDPVNQAGETLIVPATRDNAVNKLFYEADLELPAEGQWQVDILVEGPAGAGNTGFAVEALPPSGINTLLGLGWPLWAGLGLVIIAAGWWFQMSRDRKTEVRHA